MFDVQALRDFPNAVPTIGGSDTRRSDMIWSLLNRFVGGCKIVQAPLPVRQVRRSVSDAGPDFHTLAQDIRGYALYSSLHDVLLEKAQERQRRGEPPYSRRLLDLDADDIERATRLYGKYVRERSRAFELSFLRVIGYHRRFEAFSAVARAPTVQGCVVAGVTGAPRPPWLG